ncbi:LYR motif-containing protein 4 [Halyomorpha halys]|uniref:LYR motif-containing protein 4 n=1 Tax=Halyomorpha halys TaxID=286706 RepID=UPI0006D4F152|nr:LYR motif-containing protein 4-like [Halyomorpha halys]
MSVSKAQVLKLYRDMMREAKKIPAYNFRTYALRRIKHGFNENKNVKLECIKNKFNDGLLAYDSLKRQVIVSAIFKTDKIIVENQIGKPCTYG